MKLAALRDFLVLSLAFTSLHTSLYASASRSLTPLPSGSTVDCPYYDAWSVVFLFMVATSAAASLNASTRGWDVHARWLWSVDAVGLVPGIYWQVATRPAYLGMGGLTHSWERCGYEAVPAAHTLLMLGDLLTYGMLLRACMTTGFGRRAFPTGVVVSAVFAISGLQYWFAAQFRANLGA